MNIWIVLLAAQVLVTVFALLRESFRESGKDTRFDDEKLAYRS